jgi:putative nucleotidyltransferase with HDIG domain
MASSIGSRRGIIWQDRTVLKITLLIIASILSLAALVLPIATRQSTYPLKIGDVASQDIQAPYTLTFESVLLTEKARQEAVSQITPIFQPTDPSIARHQIERLRIALNYITTVRQDVYSTPQQKQSDLEAMTDLQLSRGTMENILALSDTRWQVVQQESTSVLEQTMRNSIRENGISEARRNIPTLVSLSLPQEQATIVIDLVSPFIKANSLYSAEQTEAARQQARDSVQPVKRTFITGEVIVLRGQVINAENWEAMQKYGLIKPVNNNQDFLAAAILVTALTVLIFLYFNRRKLLEVNNLRNLVLVAVTFLVFLFGARFLIPNRTIIPYLFPLPAFAFALAVVFSQETGLLFSLVISLLAAYGLSSSLDLTLFYYLVSVSGVLMLGHARRIASYFSAGLIAGAVGSGVILAYRIPGAITDWVGLATLIGASFANGMMSASLTLLLQYIYSQLLGRTTTLQLLELSRPDQPLLQSILRNSPGTYQHGLQVANLGEQAAESIGADGLLVRVGALYHDLGKSTNPQFFIENQVPGKTNPHDDLEPEVSADIIIQHIQDGLILAQKYRLPPRIMDFIREHHGTLLTRYQYTRAVEAAGGNPALVNPEKFRYSGPSPRSRETALIMMADGVEARARAELPKNEEELRALVLRTIEYYLKEGQLEFTDLTINNLSTIAESFVRTLQGTYHPRIRYPELRSTLNIETTPRKLAPANSSTDPQSLKHDIPSDQ